MSEKIKRPKDTNQQAKFVADIAVGELEKPVDSFNVKRARSAGIKGGAARMAVLTPDQRSKIARLAAAARWKKN